MKNSKQKRYNIVGKITDVKKSGDGECSLKVRTAIPEKTYDVKILNDNMTTMPKQGQIISLIGWIANPIGEPDVIYTSKYKIAE